MEYFEDLLAAVRAGLQDGYWGNPAEPMRGRKLGGFIGTFEKALTVPSREQRLAVMSFLTQRDITTSYDLTAGEFQYLFKLMLTPDSWTISTKWKEFLQECEVRLGATIPA